MNKKTALVPTILGVALLVGPNAGCGTIVNWIDTSADADRTIYGGTGLDLSSLDDFTAEGIFPNPIPCFFDLPLSLVADTLLLPFRSSSAAGAGS